MKRRIVSALLVLALVAGVLPASVLASDGGYEKIVQTLITAEETYGGEGYGMLCDIDGDGGDELVLVYDVQRTVSGTTGLHPACSVVTKVQSGDSWKVKVLVDEVLVDNGAYACVGKVTMNGLNYLGIIEMAENESATIQDGYSYINGYWNYQGVSLYQINGGGISSVGSAELQYFTDAYGDEIGTVDTFVRVNGSSSTVADFNAFTDSVDPVAMVYSGGYSGSYDYGTYLSNLLGYAQADDRGRPDRTGHPHPLTHVAYTAPTCTEQGNMEYWFCETDWMYFRDSEGENPANRDSLFLEPLGHDPDPVTGICSRCGERISVTPDEAAVHFNKVNSYSNGQFSDVTAGKWYTSYVASAYELGLMKGTSTTKFSPAGNVTVAEAITMAARIHSIYTTGSENFVQQKGKWYQVYLDYAYNRGIINSSYYNMDVTVTATRAQFAEIFAAALPDTALYPINEIGDYAIPDVSYSMNCRSAVYKLYRAGILTGSDSRGTFKPTTSISRAEAATIVARMAETNNRVYFSLN